MSDDLSEHDKELLRLIGMSGEQVLADERMAESETIPDDLTGRVHYGLPGTAGRADGQREHTHATLHTRQADRRGQTLSHQPQRVHAQETRRASRLTRGRAGRQRFARCLARGFA